jgi:hypothetical protein
MTVGRRMATVMGALRKCRWRCRTAANATRLLHKQRHSIIVRRGDETEQMLLHDGNPFCHHRRGVVLERHWRGWRRGAVCC